MTNIAFTTLVILVLAFPGYLFRAYYYSGEFTRQILPRNWTDDIAKAIVYSIPFYFVGVILIEFLQHRQIIQHTFRFEFAARVLTAEFGDSSTFAMVVNSIYANWAYITVGYLVVLGLAIVTGAIAKKVVWDYELDVKYSVLKYRSEWLYRLMGRGQLSDVTHDKILVWVDALTDLPTEISGKNRLYRGIVAGLTTNPDGSLKELILTGARWGKFKRNWNGETSFTWEHVTPGDYFYLKYEEIKNLNITYLPITQLHADFDRTG